MKRMLVIICGFAFWASSVYSEEKLEDCVLEDISFSNGNLLSWIACINRSLQSGTNQADKLLFVPVLPKIAIAPGMTNDPVLVRWTNDVQVVLDQSLCRAEPSWSILSIHDGLKIKFVKVGEVLNLLRELYGCRFSKKEEFILVYPFPENLELLCYSGRERRNRIGLNLVVGLYAAYKQNHVFLHENATTGKVYILAPSMIHKEVLAGIKKYGIAEDELNIEGLKEVFGWDSFTSARGTNSVEVDTTFR